MAAISRWTWRVKGLAILAAVTGGFVLNHIVRDAARRAEAADQVVAAGRMLFEHEWEPNDPLAGGGDGLGPVFNAKSCATCHFQGGLGGAGTNRHNVLSFTVLSNRRNPDVELGVVHAAAVSAGLQDSRKLVREQFPIVPGGTRVINGCSTTFEDFDPLHFDEVNTPPLFGNGAMDRISDADIERYRRNRSLRLIARELTGDFGGTPVGRPHVLADGRLGKFGWKGQFATVREFVAVACAVEIGLSNSVRMQNRPQEHRPDEEANVDLSDDQLAAMVAFVGSLPQPEQVLPQDETARSTVHHGEQLFHQIGCADCHPKSLGSVDGIYSDLMLHRVEDENNGGSSYRREEPEVPLPARVPRLAEWKTPPLWGVADTAPYFHDGESPTLLSAIQRHGGDARNVTDRWLRLSHEDRGAIIAFLRTLRAPGEPSPSQQATVASR